MLGSDASLFVLAGRSHRRRLSYQAVVFQVGKAGLDRSMGLSVREVGVQTSAGAVGLSGCVALIELRGPDLHSDFSRGRPGCHLLGIGSTIEID